MNNWYSLLNHRVLLVVQDYLHVVLAMYNGIELMVKKIQLVIVIYHQDDIDK
jgi:hypothetical protein